MDMWNYKYLLMFLIHLFKAVMHNYLFLNSTPHQSFDLFHLILKQDKTGLPSCSIVSHTEAEEIQWHGEFCKHFFE